MEKIYGYKEKDVANLAEFLKTKGNNSLSKVFEEYGTLNGKAKGTVRNLYYAVAKKSIQDKEFCQKYFNGTPLSVGKIIEFKDCEERQLIKKVLLAKIDGKSARSAIMEISGGDAKVALRFQNKFRNALKNKPELIKSVVEELNASGKKINFPEKHSLMVSEEHFSKLKGEINNLVAKIALKEKQENQLLKDRISVLEKENLRLYNALYGNKETACPINFFRAHREENILN